MATGEMGMLSVGARSLGATDRTGIRVPWLEHGTVKVKTRKARSQLVRPVRKHVDRKRELKKRGPPD